MTAEQGALGRIEKTVDKLGPIVVVELSLPVRLAAEKIRVAYDRSDPAWEFSNMDYVLAHGVLDAQTSKPLKSKDDWALWGTRNWPAALDLYNEINGLSDPAEEAAKN